MNPPRRPWLIIVYASRLLYESHPLKRRCRMRFPAAFFACLCLFAGSAAWADSRVFIIANQADGYGVDQCLAKGETCGAHAALSYCRSRNFAEATAYRRVEPDEITGSVPKLAENCGRGRCKEYIAITCQR